MNKYLKPLLFIILLGIAGPLDAQSAKVITLKDGSVIKGNVLQLADGVYTLETSNLGKITVPEAEVVSITAETASAPQEGNTASASLKSQAQEIQTNLLSDPSIMAEIQNIMQDPEVRGVLSDPAFMNAIMSYDPGQIQQNEKTQYLLQNPKFQSLMEKVQQKLPASK